MYLWDLSTAHLAAKFDESHLILLRPSQGEQAKYGIVYIAPDTEQYMNIHLYGVLPLSAGLLGAVSDGTPDAFASRKGETNFLILASVRQRAT